ISSTSYNSPTVSATWSKDPIGCLACASKSWRATYPRACFAQCETVLSSPLTRWNTSMVTVRSGGAFQNDLYGVERQSIIGPVALSYNELVIRSRHQVHILSI